MPERTLALIYHDVASDGEEPLGFPGAVADRYKLSRRRFLEHLEALEGTGLGFGVGDAERMLTFDDGGASAPWVAEQLEARGWRGAFFVVTSRIGTPGFMDADAVRGLAARGHQIGSHSHTHPPYMGRLDPARLAEEWQASRALLSELLGAPITSAAAPGGSVSGPLIAAAAEAGYQRLYTSTPSARMRSAQGGIRVVGRYTMWATDPPELAAAIARGAPVPRVRRWLGWQAKSAAKRISPRIYESARVARAGRPSGSEAAERKNDASRLT